MRVLVCGGRDFADANLLDRTLNEIHEKTPISCIIEGGATGADALAFRWASTGNRVGTELYAAEWSTHGRKAGPIRNQRMLDEGKPDLVVAFPGGKGTADMVAKARRAGVRVMVVEADDRRSDSPEVK